MDQLKVILKYIQKYHFWLLSAAAIIAGLVGSTIAARSLSAAYKDGKQKIDSKFQALKSILGTNPHPNSEWEKGVKKLNGEEQAKVRKAWEQVYNEQKSLLTWPKQLEDDFLKFIADNPATAVIPEPLRERYQTVAKEEFPRLAKIIGAASLEVAKEKSGKTTEAKHLYRVDWETANQTDIRQSLDWESVPSSAEVRRAQEDFWVYTALLTMIKNVNDEHQYTTPIRTITTIAIGRAAANAFEADMSVDHIKHLRPGDRPPPLKQGPAGDSAEGVAKPPDDGRYVDATGKKLPAGSTADADFKRMPVFLKLSIDQREITRLLVECANSPLPVDVRQLRINPSNGAASKRLGAAGAKGELVHDASPYDVPIELHGVIYIFNKPNMAKLGGEAGSGAAPGAAPAPPAG